MAAQGAPPLGTSPPPARGPVPDVPTAQPTETP